MYKLIVFDLDGTLLDTLDDLTASTNAALRLHGFPTRTKEEVRSFIGDGIVKLLERSVGVADYPNITQMVGDFRAYYALHNKDATRPYAGIKELLQTLKNKGFILAVLSNKVHAATQTLIADYFPDTFDVVMGENEAAGIKRKPSPTALLKMLETLNVTEQETVYVGDSEVDIQTANNAGVDCISVAWGFKTETFLKDNGASVIVKTAKELEETLLKNKALKIGNTPLLKLDVLKESYGLLADIYAKAEYENEGGSIKDRVALKMIEEAEKTGALTTGGTIIEPTSGNTGIGLALVARARGYKSIIVMPNTMSVERQQLIRSYGGEVVLTDGKGGMAAAIKKAEELQKTTPNSIIAGQFENPANPKAHYETTAPETWRALNGDIDIFVTSVGTGGTLTGIGKYLKEKKPGVKIVAVEPAASPLLSKGVAGTHAIQGIGANFIPKVLDRDIYDEVLTVTDEEAFAFAKILYKKENVFAGISSGANVAAAIKLGKREENKGKNIVTVLPDSGDRYVSLKIYE